MKLSGYILDGNIRVNLDCVARPLADGSYSFRLEGLPLAWSKEKAQKLLDSWAYRNRFRSLTVRPVKASHHAWVCVVRFWAPKAPVRTYKSVACPACRAEIGKSCRNSVRGLFCPLRVDAFEALYSPKSTKQTKSQ